VRSFSYAVSSGRAPWGSVSFVGHGRLLIHLNKGYESLKKKLCNEYFKLGLNHRSSNRNVCKAY